MYEVARAVLRARSLGEVVSAALAALPAIVSGPSSVGIVDQRAGTWTLHDATDAAPGTSRRGRPLPLDTLRDVVPSLRRGRACRVDDVDRHARLRDVLPDDAPDALWLQPIRRDGLLVATLNVGLAPGASPDDAHQRDLVELAELVSDALASVRLREELIAAHDHAREANEAKTAFLTQMSHELRTPLNAIVGYVELLREEPDEAPVGTLRADLERIHQSSLHLRGLIDDVLDLAKVEAGRMDVTLTPVDLHALLSELEGTVRPLVDGRGNVYRWQCPETVVVMADPMRLRQVLLNLVGNAAKFTGQGVVSVEVEALDDRRARVTVADTGVGISPPHLDTLFDPFTQAHDRREYGGTGLGLAISQRYAELMGTRIEVRSEVGVGSRFWIDLDQAPSL